MISKLLLCATRNLAYHGFEWQGYLDPDKPLALVSSVFEQCERPGCSASGAIISLSTDVDYQTVVAAPMISCVW
jgi:hypothetical protein